jgi:hypothetical protein
MAGIVDVRESDSFTWALVEAAINGFYLTRQAPTLAALMVRSSAAASRRTGTPKPQGRPLVSARVTSRRRCRDGMARPMRMANLGGASDAYPAATRLLLSRSTTPWPT